MLLRQERIEKERIQLNSKQAPCNWNDDLKLAATAL